MQPSHFENATLQMLQNILQKSPIRIEQKENQQYDVYSNETNECILDNCSNNDIYKYEYKNNCYESCPKGTFNNTFLCEGICNKTQYYDYNKSECLNEIPKGYYLNDSELRTIDLCNIKCKNCSLESNKYNLCISCNNEQQYFQKLNDNHNP